MLSGNAVMAGSDGLDFAFDAGNVYGVAPDVTPTGSDTQIPPAQPANVAAGPAASSAAVAAAQQAGATLTAAPLWRWPVVQAFALAAIGVVFIGHAAYVAAKA